MLQRGSRILGLLQAQGITVLAVGLGVLLQGLGLSDHVEIGVHQCIGSLQRLLRPPQAGTQRYAGSSEQHGIEQGERFQAHGSTPVESDCRDNNVSCVTA